MAESWGCPPRVAAATSSPFPGSTGQRTRWASSQRACLASYVQRLINPAPSSAGRCGSGGSSWGQQRLPGAPSACLLVCVLLCLATPGPPPSVHASPGTNPAQAIPGGRKSFHGERELYSSDHLDEINSATVIGKCIVHTMDEYRVSIWAGPGLLYADGRAGRKLGRNWSEPRENC